VDISAACQVLADWGQTFDLMMQVLRCSAKYWDVSRP
jgi:hypothetical protein